ncbi:MAG: HAD-superfamily hydrolase, subfamily variant 3 [Frankiales bacterium]|jgi:HAD superfamily hydrolase (TIGR01549 family)|nr:HAD-superfamily hydrolase, subfamily variant 3 [Frankiales bacterium]
MTQSPPAVNPGAALVLDVDGTLLDTVYLHVVAWWESFLAAGYEVSCLDIHRSIGRGSSDLVQTLVGREDESVVEGHDERWQPLRERCLAFHGVADLIRACAERGLSIVYCTSGSDEDVEDFRRKIGCDDVVAAVVNSSDVESSKPAPDIVRAALDAVGVSPERAVMVGDSVFDVRAAKAAGVACIGLRTGGISERELRESGAVAVYGNPSELLQELSTSPIARLLDG